MNQGEQYYFTVNINYDHISSATTTTTTIISSTSTKPTSNGTSTTTNEMDGTIGIGRKKHCTAVPTTTSARYSNTTGNFLSQTFTEMYLDLPNLCSQTKSSHAYTAQHNPHTIHSKVGNCTQRTTWESGHPVPQLARSGPYSHDGERAAQSQITITNHKQAHCISPPLHTDQHLLATLDKKT